MSGDSERYLLGHAVGLGLFWIVAGMIPARACTVPVFRYALDRWEPDHYRLVVDPAWASTPDGLRLLAPLRGNGPANLAVEEESRAKSRLEFPGEGGALWEGVLDVDTLGSLLDSPARRELVRRLVGGDSVVWVVFPGTRADDLEAEERLAARLRFLEQVGSLPEQDPSDPESRLGPGPPLALRFSVLRVEGDDPREFLFRKQLAGPDGADQLQAGTGFAAPVFGRGRVLGAWPLAALEDAMIEDTSLFLIGRCSCRVKNENPGWDLLLRADWEGELASASVVAEVPESRLPITTTTTTTTTSEVNVPGRRGQPWVAWAGFGMAAGLVWAGWNLWRAK